MFNKTVMNKKIIFAIVILLLILGIGILIFTILDSEKKENGTLKTEQDGKDEIEDHKEEDSVGLEVLEPDNVSKEDTTDASGSWEKPSNSNKTDKEEKPENSNLNESTDEKQNEEKDEDILEDDIVWGDVY